MSNPWRIVMHWTAGVYNPSKHDLDSYNFVIDQNGRCITGVPVDAQIPDAPGVYNHPYAAHTAKANGNCVGISMAGMALALPTNYGKFPLTLAHWDTAVQVAAQVCVMKSIEPSRATLVGHCEVQKLWGPAQVGKWDPWAPLPAWAPRIGTAKDPYAIGDIFRQQVAAAIPTVRRES